MKCVPAYLHCALLVILGLSRPQVTNGAKDMGTPMQKVMQLLKQMKTKGEKEMGEERVQFAAFNQFCTDKISSTKASLDDAADQIESLEADIDRYSASAARLSGEIDAYTSSIGEKKQEMAKSTKVRKTEAEDYAEAHKDLSESVDAIGRAIDVLKAQKANNTESVVPNAGFKNKSLLQLQRAASLLQLTGADAKALQFLEQLSTKPKVDGYGFQSGGVLGMLSGLEDKFVDEKRDLEKSELKKKQEYELLQSSLQIEMDMHEKAKAKKEGFKSKALADKAQTQASLEEVKDSRAEDQKYHDDLAADCKMKSADFAQRQKVRAAELEAVDKATDILKDLALVQKPKVGTALALRRSDVSKAKRNPAEDKVYHFLQERANALHSKVLGRLAMQVSQAPASTDTGIMNYIENMLKSLLTKLQKEEIKDTELKSWCDEELKTNSQTRAQMTDDEASLQAEIDVLKSSVTKLTEDSIKLKSDVSDIDSSMAQATKLRNEEKATNEKSIKEAEEGQKAVTAAIAVLKDYYESAMGTILLQHRQAAGQKPEFAAGAYTGNGQSNIIDMLEVISSDFTQEQAETKASEDASLKAYREFITESKVDKAKKAAAAKRYDTKVSQKTMTVNEQEVDLKSTQEKLQAALDYFEELKPKCVNTDLAYEAEKKQKKDTIESLQKALTMLNSYQA
eukprot:TRINITY_DN11343_c0_g2_i1.p1 TRINITY_DN11343_c0_g2~~TRINITY_DN11343_c0_g2_i1.p1  ORF type:complete len:681 (-),score=204.02 TRINITY_DN11343_c0_g2_i1:59-2101(-)